MGKGAAFLFIDSISGVFFGYFFWFILSKVTTPEIIGTASTLVSLSIIFVAVAMIGVANGVQRFLGKNFLEKNLGQAKVFIKAAILLVTIGIFASSAILLFLGDWILNYYHIDVVLVFITILLVAATCFTNLFRGIVISSLKTKILPVINIISGSIKIGLAIILVSIGMGAVGVMIGIISFFALSSSLLAINVIMIIKSSEKKSEIKLKDTIRLTFSAGVVTWIPELIMKPGIHLGTIIVFGFQGASQAGVYFIGFSVFYAILQITFVLLTIGFPLLSGMSDGRKKLAWRLTKMSLAFGMPISSIFIFYANDILLVFGKEYSEGSFALQVLLFSMLPLIIGMGVRTLVYAYGNYRQVLAIGLGQNLPRIILYFILIPMYGILGAALSFTVGSIIGFIISIIIAKKVGLNIFAKDLMIIFAIPIVLGFVLSYYEINFALSIITILIVSYISYLRIGITTREDLNDSIMILPKKISSPTLKILNKIVK